MKECRICKEIKVPEMFSASSQNKDGLYSYCKPCANTRMRNYASRRKDIRYRMPKDGYLDLVKKQKGLCKICKSDGGGRSLHVDHCHTTGKVRGLLCSNCNTGLGLFKDNVDLLKKAIKYLC